MLVTGGLRAASASRSGGGFDGRLRVVRVPCAQPGRSLASAVCDGLRASPKSLPCRFFYDAEGSRLFEEICRLPEYYPTRTEEAILARIAPEIARRLGPGTALTELGSGSAAKTRLLVEALLERQETLHYVPVDISAAFLEESARALLARFPGLTVTALGGEYDDALPLLPPHDGPRLVLFLGGNIGNFEDAEAVALLGRLGEALEPSDRLLVGFDRLKSPTVIERAYNDEAGVTAAFNRNLLARINRELGGEFALDAFDHAAPFVAERSRVEMHLVSRRRQEVPVAALGTSFRFEDGETIHTESSHKYTVPAFTALAEAAGFSPVALFSDPGEWFSLALLAPGPGATR